MRQVGFKDHFSGLAAEYARHRPRYPPALAAYLATLSPRHELALDLATGNGQAAIDLAAHFDCVLASDASARQLAEVSAHERVVYACHGAESLPLRAASVDLIAVAQAAHWLDFARFYPEVQRVLRPQGILALWTYGLFGVDAPIDALIGSFYADVVGPYWPPERRYIDERYATLPFPLHELTPPAFEIVADLTLPDVLGYLGTWSAVDRYRAARGEDPLPRVSAALAEVWGAPGPRRLRWPIYLRVGTV